jgi:hypothetical protein
MGDMDGGWKVSMNICGTSNVKECSDRSGAICQYTTFPTDVAASLGSWAGQPAPVWSILDATDVNKGIVLTYSNGESQPCFPAQRIAVIHFLCAAKTGSGFTVHEDPTCTYLIKFNTPLACVTVPGGGDDDDGALSGGWIFVICLACVIPVYITAGCLYGYKKKGSKGIEACPNIEFWKDLPHLIKDGTLFSIKKMQACFGWIKDRAQGTRGGAQPVPETATS